MEICTFLIFAKETLNKFASPSRATGMENTSKSEHFYRSYNLIHVHETLTANYFIILFSNLLSIQSDWHANAFPFRQSARTWTDFGNVHSLSKVYRIVSENAFNFNFQDQRP